MPSPAVVHARLPEPDDKHHIAAARYLEHDSDAQLPSQSVSGSGLQHRPYEGTPGSTAVADAGLCNPE
ncbi:hypothetical protein A2U01_0000423 [Trifolium medium]|uniref:Uncharacterized protein n=1 Tax=Trifolium medium TaxID=97028 RepID=A0A392LXI8_9FABA|nr:hypothetical protein [Trifolium medium]